MAVTTTDPFERLYRRYARDVYRFVLSVVRNPVEAEDVTQTTFLNAYRAIRRGDRPERPHSWLIAIAHNAIRSRHRWTLRRPKEVPLESAVHYLSAPTEERGAFADVLRALGALPVNQRTALAMRELEGRSYPEIAETLGVSVPAVESLIARARRTLRAQRAALRGLILVQVPRSLSSFLQQSDATTGQLAAKAAAVVAAAGVVAGTASLGTNGGASRPGAAAALPQPAHAQLIGAAIATPRHAGASPVARTAKHPEHASRPARVERSRPAPQPTPPAAAQPTAASQPAQAPAAAAPRSAPAAATHQAPSQPAPPPPTTTTTDAVEQTTTAAEQTVPVDVPQLPAVPAPAVPALPPLPALPPPPALPGVPQVSAPAGI